MVRFFQVVVCYLGAFIGAGFASGKEIQLFFARFPGVIYPALVCAGLLFAFLGYAAIDLCRRACITSSRSFFTYCLGDMTGRGMFAFLQLFLFCSVTVMVAAGDSLCQMFFSLPPGMGGAVLSFCLFLLLLYSQRGMVAFNTAFVPLLLFLLFVLWHRSIPSESWHMGGEAFSLYGTLRACFWALLYVSYNFFGVCTIFVPFGVPPHGRAAAVGGCFAGLFLGVLLFLATLALCSAPAYVAVSPMPFLSLAMEQGVGMWLYGAALFGAILTTALANSFSLLQSASSVGKAVFVAAAFFIACCWDFSVLVACLYPIAGGFGLLLVFALIYRFFTPGK